MYFSLLVFVGIAISIVGLIVLVLGVRGRSVFSWPKCVKCGYDLRAMNFMASDIGRCPECGTNLNTPRSVNFGRLQRSRRILVTGAAMLLLPWGCIVLALNMHWGLPPSPQRSAKLTNQALLAQLPTTIDQPWDWQELERRLASNSLSTQEAETALAALTSHLTSQRAKGQPVHGLPWSGAFVKSALALGNFDPETRRAFLAAYYPAPAVKVRRTVRLGQDLEITEDYPGQIELGDMQICWFLRSIVVDGNTPIELKDADKRGRDFFSGGRYSGLNWRWATQLAPGEHELVFTFDQGVVPNRAAFRGVDGRPGSPDKWPSPLAVWQSEVRQKIQVVPAGAAVVALIKDAAIEPARDAAIGISEAMVRPASNGKEIVLSWTQPKALDIPLVYRVEVVAGGQTVATGNYALVKRGKGESRSEPARCDVKALPPDVKTIDLKFVPDPKAAEAFGDIDQILGTEFWLRDIPLKRFDLEN